MLDSSPFATRRRQPKPGIAWRPTLLALAGGIIMWAGIALVLWQCVR